jgi:sugar lactone lactonase YvrE
MVRFLPCAFWIIACAALNPGVARASAPRYDDIMPISQVRAGMKGYGLTVFRGTTISKFDVMVVGVVKRGSLIIPGHDMILVKMWGGPMTTRQANLIRGMSGSPVYINGKIIGAFSQGEPMTKEPLGGVTPIEDMLEAWDPKLPDTPLSAVPDNRVRTVTLDRPLQVGTRRIAKIVYNVPMRSGLRSHGTTLVMHPCTTFATFSGASRAARERLAKALEPYNVELVQGIGGGQKPGFKGSALVPGAAFSMMLVTGDMFMGATGTVSYRRENRILGFGHPFMGIGPIDAPLCSAYVYDIYPLLMGSYKISSPGPVVGSSLQDRNFAVSGVIGKTPKTIPITVDVRDLTTGRSRVFHSQSVSHLNLYSTLVSATVESAVDEIRSTPGPTMARVVTTVDADQIGKVTRSNIVFSTTGIDGAATQDLDELLGILTSNPFYQLGIKSAEVKVEIESGRRTAQIERIFLKEGRFEPGETVEVGLVIKPYKQPSVIKTIRVRIPPNTLSGRYMLQVRGGAVPPPISLGGFILRAPAPQNPEQAPPANIRQMVNRYDEREKNNEIVARLLLPTTAVDVEGEKLSNLPPSLDAVMRSAKSSGVRLDRDEVRAVEPTDWVISGQQMLAVNVQRQDSQETPSAAPPAGAVPSGAPPGPAAPGATSYAQEEDDDAAQRWDGARRTQDEFSALQPSEFRFQSSDKKPKDNQEKKPADKTRPATTTPAEPAAPAAPAPAAEDKPVVRAPLVWRQTSRADFARGILSGVSVSTHGDLLLTRTLHRLQTSTESFVWSLIADGKGGLYAGTGAQGKILHLDAAGHATLFADLPELSVHSLLLAPDGTLWAATGPNGRTYRIAPDGKFTLAHQAKEKYALALARDSKGNIYVGTGGGAGVIYRIAPDGATSLFFKSSEEHVLALAMDKSDNLYAGTSTAGILYRITPAGTASVLYDAPEQSITSVAVNSKGSIYVATAPRGVLYHITPDGMAKTVYEKAPAAFTALCAAPDDTVYAAAGSNVYEIRPDDTITPLDNNNDVDILSLTAGADGMLYAGTGNVAEIYAAAPSPAKRTGSYLSVAHDAKQVSRWGTIRWTASIPAGTRLFVQSRSGNVSEPDTTWSAWATPRPEPDGGRITSPPARFIQYRVVMESDSSTISPCLRDISVTYLPKNQPPKVSFQSPSGGERWAKQQTVRWEASDADKDALSYELFYSSDDGAHWTPVPASAAPAAPAASPPPSTPPAATGTAPAQGGGRKPPSVEQVTAELDRHPELPQALRSAILERAKEANAAYQAGQAGTATAPAAAPAATRETSRALDTKALQDGAYMLKVVATDRVGNPTDPQSAEAVSEPFVICNTPPALYVLKAATKINADRTVSLEGAALQNLIPVTAVQYRVDGGEWIAASPADGIFDSTMESFTLTTAPLAPGTHTIEVKAFNAANTTAAEKVSVEVK